MGRWASADFPHLPITSYSGVHIFLLCALEAVFLSARWPSAWPMASDRSNAPFRRLPKGCTTRVEPSVLLILNQPPPPQILARKYSNI